MPPPALTLKQRLAELQQSISNSNGAGPSAQNRPAFGTFGAALGKRRPSFTRLNTRTKTNMETAQGSMHAVDEVLARMIFQAGVDFEYVLAFYEYWFGFMNSPW